MLNFNKMLASHDIWLNINKPKKHSSAKVVAIVKKITGAKKVGHGGTLDPFASGVLPIALNKATKTSNHLMSQNKKYNFTIKWGEFRDTDDIDGKVIESNEKRPSTNDIIFAMFSFIGEIKQTPSSFSAIRINGQKAYKLARKNINFEMPPRIIEILSFKLISNDENYANFEIECSKGTYIRTIARDLSLKLNVCGFVSELTRVKVGNFCYDKTISLDDLKLNSSYYCMDFLDISSLNLKDITK